jgi:hypothetical protein
MPEMSSDKMAWFSWGVVYVLLGVLIAVGIVDIVLVRRNPGGPSVSSTIWGLAKEYPIIVLLVGILLGHLFWPQH